jgi:hypothetical protein
MEGEGPFHTRLGSMEGEGHALTWGGGDGVFGLTAIEYVV